MPDTTPLVAFYTHTLYNGGIERVLLNLAESFVARNVRVEFVVNTLGWSPFEKQIPESIKLVNLAAAHFGQRPFRLAAYLRREKPKAILSAGHFSNEVAVLAGKLAGLGTRVVVTEHTTQTVELQTLPALHPRRLLLPGIAKLAYRWADQIVAVSEGAAKDIEVLLGLPRGRATTIYNAVVTPKLIERSGEPLLHPWFAPGQPPVILGIGRVELQKDFANLIEAFRLVRAKMNARLLILGEGSLRDSLSAQIEALGLQNDAQLAGFVENPYTYMRGAGVFVLSSAWEGLPTVLIEALACGTPVVSTDCPSGPAEILDGGRLGSIVPVRNSQRLADEILAVLQSSAPRTTDSSWLSQFTPGVVTQRYLDALGVT